MSKKIEMGPDPTQPELTFDPTRKGKKLKNLTFHRGNFPNPNPNHK